MKVTFFDRKFNPKEISIEKVFDQVRANLSERKIAFTIIKNPYDFGLYQIVKGIVFFYKNKGKVNHITGYIHWSILFQNPRNTILTIHDIGRYWELSGFRRSIFYYLWVYLPIRKAMYVTTISNKTKEDILSLLPWAASKITVIPNCFTIPVVDHLEFKMNEIPKILIVGTRSNKNIEKSIQALKGLKIDLTIIGELTTAQTKLLEQCEIQFTNLSFIPETELIDIYKSSNILLFMSLFEGFGLPILEAQSQNCIVITSDLQPMNEVGGIGAIYANPTDIDSINKAVIKVISMCNEDHVNIITEGKKNVKKYSVNVISEQYLQLYHKLNQGL